MSQAGREIDDAQCADILGPLLLGIGVGAVVFAVIMAIIIIKFIISCG